ncbi:Rho GTPase-activating protein 21 [Irineochytrium annulatum]|nr:Rho GTPase-activating protein 21 [Irineochytrium annulatum]
MDAPTTTIAQKPSLASLLASAPPSTDPEGWVFDTNLTTSVARSGRNGVPHLLLACLPVLDAQLATEGLYRVPGSLKRVKEWQETFEGQASSAVPDLDDAWTSDVDLPRCMVVKDVEGLKDEGVPTVASLVKRFLSKIRDGGLAGNERFWVDLETVILDRTVPPAEMVEKVKARVLAGLPTRTHLATVAYLFAHLRRVADHADENKMTSRNLAISLFPGGMVGAEYLIEHFREIFGDDDGRALLEKPVEKS